MKDNSLIVVGGGLSGCEAAWQAAQRGIHVTLYEMRPSRMSGAHTTALLGELVCSNSLGSRLRDRPNGLLIEELRGLGSLLIRCAEETMVPAGRALAVDRLAFSSLVEENISNHPNIEVVRREITEIPASPTIFATGPLTSEALADQIQTFIGTDCLYFYDAIAPIISSESINLEVAFRASRYEGNETGDYINCPMNKLEYVTFVDALLSAKRIPLKEYERDIKAGVISGAQPFFERCLPIEIMAERSREALAFGPMRPIGLIDPRDGRRPYAIVQLRQDNLAATLYSLVGFQTNLTYPEQKRLIRMIPGLENAEIVRYGQMHRNTYILAPRVLRDTLQTKNREDVFFAGQLCGMEGYVGNIGTGLYSGWNAANYLRGKELIELPRKTMLGTLIYYLTHADNSRFQPMKANFGLLPPLDIDTHKHIGRRQRAVLYVDSALAALQDWIDDLKQKNDQTISDTGWSDFL